MPKLEKNEELIIGSIAGSIGAVAKYAFNELAQLLSLAKYDNNATALGVVLKTWQHTPVYWIIGFFIAIIIGAFFGVIIAFMFSYIFAERFYLLKGAIIGIGIWLFNFGIMSNVFNYPPDIKTSLGDIMSMLVSLIIYGVVTVFSLKLFSFLKIKQ